MELICPEVARILLLSALETLAKAALERPEPLPLPPPPPKARLMIALFKVAETETRLLATTFTVDDTAAIPAVKV